MPQPIYLPENPNTKMLRALTASYMQMLMAKSMKDPTYTQIGPEEPGGANRIARYDRKLKKLVPTDYTAPMSKANDKQPTFTSIEGLVFDKWRSDKPLTEKETRIIDRRFRSTGTRKSPADVKADALARYEAWREGFEKYVGRPPSELEARKKFLNDIYGILEPEELPEGLTEEDIKFNMKKYNKSRVEIIDQYINTQGK